MKNKKEIILGSILTLLALTLIITSMYQFYLHSTNKDQTNNSLYHSDENQNAMNTSNTFDDNQVREEEKNPDQNQENENKEPNKEPDQNQDENTENKVTIYLFHGNKCPHCINAISNIKEDNESFKNYNVVTYEVWANKENSAFLDEVLKEINYSTDSVPLFIVGSTPFVGYRKDDILKQAQIEANNKDYQDIIQKVEKDHQDLKLVHEKLK